MYKRVLATVAVASMALFSVAFAASQFSDVPMTHWASGAISWAADNGLMTGPGDAPGTFDPAGSVNRAQLATVLYRYDQMMSEKLDGMMEEETMTEEETTPAETMSEDFYYRADLDGAQEVPPVETGATGTAEMTLTGNTLSYTITVEGLSGPVTGAHFHLGVEGEDGDVEHTITFDGNTATGTWTDLSPNQLSTLEVNGYYVNVHTEANPDGEIRGQVVPDDAKILMEEDTMTEMPSGSFPY